MIGLGMRCAGVGKWCNEEGSAKESIPKYRSAEVYSTFSIILIYIGRNDNPELVFKPITMINAFFSGKCNNHFDKIIQVEFTRQCKLQLKTFF